MKREMKKEVIKKPESAAQEALGQGHFDLFFAHLSAIEEDRPRTGLITEAINIAQEQKNIEVLTQLTRYSSICTYHSETIFNNLLTAFIELEAVDKAIQTTLLYEDDTLEPKVRWSTLMRILFQRHDFVYLHRVYPHVKQGLIDKTFLQEIMHRCLHAASVRQRPLDWLFWLREYRCFYQNEDFVNAQLNEIADFILRAKNFKNLCQQIIRTPEQTLINLLLIKLFERCVVRKETKLLAELIILLPSSVHWLLQTQKPFTQAAEFGVLNKLENAYRLAFLEQQLSQYLDRQKSVEDKALEADILAIAEAVRGYQQPVIECACHLLIAQDRMTPVFDLLSRLSHAAAKRAVISKLLRHSLTEARYQQLLSDIPYLELCEYKTEVQAFLKPIPPTLVAAEAKQRRQRIAAEAETKWATVTEIGHDHSAYSALLQTFRRLMECGLYGAAAMLCRKMKATDSRNAQVKILLNAVLRLDQESLLASDWRLAEEIAGLLYPSEKAKVCREQIEILAKTYPSRDYQNAFSALVILNVSMGDLFPDTVGLVRCADALLEAKDSAVAGALFLVKQGLFSIVKRMPSTHPLIKTAERAVINVIEAHTDDALKDWLQEIQTTLIVDFAECMTDLLLIRSRLLPALHLLNAVTSEKIAWAVQRKIADYLKTVSPSEKYIEILKQVTSPQRQSDLMESVMSTVFRLPIDHTHLVLLTAIPQDRLRQRYLMDYVLSAILDAKFDLARQALVYLPDTQKILWLKIIQWIQEKNFEQVLDELLKYPQDFHHQQFLTWLSQHYGELHLGEADCLWKRLHQHHRLYLELHQDIKKIESGQTIALHDLHRTLCLDFFEQWAELIHKQGDYPLLLNTCQKLFIPHPGAFDPYFSWQTYLGNLVWNWIAWRQFSQVETIAKLLLSYDGAYTTQWLGQLIQKLLAQLAWKCIESIRKLLPTGYADEWRILIGEHHFRYRQDDKAVQELILVENKNWFHYQGVVIEQMQVLISRRDITSAQDIGEKLLAGAPDYIYQPVIETLVKKNYLSVANNYIAKMSACPELQSQLRQQVQQVYQCQLEQWLGKEKAHYLFDTFDKIVQCLRLSKQSGQGKLANRLKNELIVECRSQLDKIFLAFCRQRYGQVAPGKNGKIPYRYFPVVPKLEKGETVEVSLRGYFRRLFLVKFPQDNPELYQYLLDIQPLQNLDYQWLSDLYVLANQQKHSEDLPWQPQIASRAIDMVDYLPCLLNGLCEIFLKIARPEFPVSVLPQWRFSQYFPLEKSTVVGQVLEQKRAPDLVFRQSGRESSPGTDVVSMFSLFTLSRDDKNLTGSTTIKKFS